MKFKAPDSTIISVRVSRADSALLTEAARYRGTKLSTFIREAALEQVRVQSAVIWFDGRHEVTTA